MITYHKVEPLKGRLRLKNLKADHRVAHLLPFEVAKEYHALPVAAEGQIITVALADPADAQATAALYATLGKEICFVQADADSIDEQIGVIWPNTSPEPISISFWSREDEESQYVKYLANFCEVINAQYSCISIDPSKVDTQIQGIQSEKTCDLFIYARSEVKSGRLKWNTASERKFLRKVPYSTLVLQNMRWPIQNMLLFVHSLDLDESTLAWTVSLGSTLGVDVRITPLLPILPAGYANDPNMAYSIPKLLKSDCQLGKRLRKICAVLDEYDVKGTLELQSASFPYQRSFSQFDLILVSGVVKAGRQNIYYHDVIQQLLRVENINLLVSKGNPFHKYLID